MNLREMSAEFDDVVISEKRENFDSYLYIEMQKRLRMEAVEKTTSMAWYMSHSHTENSQWPSRRTLMALNPIAPTDTERSKTNE